MVAFLAAFLTAASLLLLQVFDKKAAEKTIVFRSVRYSLRDVIRMGLGILLFLIYMPHLFSLEIISLLKGLENPVFSPFVTILLALLKWLSFLSFAVAVVLPFFKKENLRRYAGFFGFLSVILNLIFFDPVMMTITGVPSSLTDFRSLLYAAILMLVGVLSGDALLSDIRNGTITLKTLLPSLKSASVFLIVYALPFMPEYLLQLFFGLIGDVPKDFVPVHRFLIYVLVLFLFGSYFVLRNKPLSDRRFYLVFLSLSGFLQYFYVQPQRPGLAALPFHLCNFAIVMMFFAFVFKSDGIFYFSYFVNVLGAIFAFLMPNTTEAFTSIHSLLFFYNHTYAIVLPLLGVALGVFEKPRFRLILRAAGFFSLYMLAAVFLDGYLNNMPTNNPSLPGYTLIDYFFLYSDFFTEKAPFAIPLRLNYIWTIPLGDVNMKIHWLYDIVIYVVFVATMFAEWGIYTLFFRVSDAHKELERRSRLRRIDHLNLLSEMNGRPLSEPLHKEGIDMIRISHFSKNYSGSDVRAVDDLSLEVKAGEVFGFIGHNGAGKSTTIKCLVGMQTISEGTIEIEGYDIARQPLEAKLNIGFVSDNHALYEQLTGREYVEYVAGLYMVSPEDRDERLKKYAEMFRMTESLDREIRSYSHGMKQKIMVISALIHDPKVWVLDEPLTGLDPTSAYQIKECMRAHADAGNIVFFSSHVIEVVEKVCDRIAIISGGKLRYVATMKELKEKGIPLEQLYLQYSGDLAESDERAESSGT